MKKPVEFADALGEYGPCFYDGWSDKPVAWGFKINKRIGDDAWVELGKHGDLQCAHGSGCNWYLITKELDFPTAVKQYGKVTKLVTGPRGGFKHIVFGKTKFSSRNIRPDNKELTQIDKDIIEIE